MKRVYKYGTGQQVPEGAVYLTTVVEESNLTRFVWHYFLVEDLVK
jgi:hypothetical protein